MTTSEPMDRRSDLELVEAIRRGDSRAFDVLYYRYRDWVVGLAYRFAGNRDDALDVLQETFTYLLRKLPDLELKSRLTTLLYPAVKNLSIASRRKRRRFQSRDEASGDPGFLPVESSEGSRADLAVVMGNLPEEQRETILMRFVDGMTLDEIALALEIPPGTVKSRLHNGLARLREDPRVRDYFENL